MHNLSLSALIASGASADVIRLSKGLVVKLFRADVEPGVVTRELDGAQRAVAAGLLVPRPMGSRIIENRHGIVFEELDGVPLIESGSGWRIARARAGLRKLAACHARIHQCSADGLEHQQHVILRVRIEAAETDDALKQAALDRLHALPQGDRLCHGDFHPGNAIETAQGTAAIDWSNGSAGTSAGDVVRTELLLRYGMYGDVLKRSRLARWFRQRAAAYYLDHYRAITGMTAAQLEPWYLPVAVSCLGGASKIHRPSLLNALAHWR